MEKSLKKTKKKESVKGHDSCIFVKLETLSIEGKRDLVEALITYARVNFKVNYYSRQTIWRFKKELKEIGLSDELLKQLTAPP